MYQNFFLKRILLPLRSSLCNLFSIQICVKYIYYIYKLTGVGIDLLTIISHKVSNVTEDRSGFE